MTAVPRRRPVRGARTSITAASIRDHVPGWRGRRAPPAADQDMAPVGDRARPDPLLATMTATPRLVSLGSRRSGPCGPRPDNPAVGSSTMSTRGSATRRQSRPSSARRRSGSPPAGRAATLSRENFVTSATRSGTGTSRYSRRSSGSRRRSSRRKHHGLRNVSSPRFASTAALLP